MQCWLAAPRGSHNVSELSDVPADQQKLWEDLLWKPVHGDVRVGLPPLGRLALADTVDSARWPR